VHARPPEQLAHVLRRDRQIVGAARRELAGDLSRHRADLALELAHAALARVVRHDAHHGVVGEHDVLALEPRLLDLTRDQVLLRDLRLLALGVARELDDLHAVDERTGDVLDEVRRGDEQHLAQVERNAR
jgi:hypothetical protein